jgi:hypothetical protein
MVVRPTEVRPSAETPLIQVLLVVSPDGWTSTGAAEATVTAREAAAKREARVRGRMSKV